MVKTGVESTLVLEYDQTAGKIRYTCGENSGESPQLNKLSGVTSYIHLQSLAESADPYSILLAGID